MADAVTVSSEKSEVSALLSRWSAGDRGAYDQLIPLVYDRLRQLARRQRRSVRRDESLNTTALVHETYLKLAGASALEWPDRGHFLALASQVMRNLLVDRARARAAAKRGGGRAPLELDESLSISEEDLETVAEVDEALARLEEHSPRQCRILECRYFGGLSLQETASALGISLATVKRELRLARAWLALELGAKSPR